MDLGASACENILCNKSNIFARGFFNSFNKYVLLPLCSGMGDILCSYTAELCAVTRCLAIGACGPRLLETYGKHFYTTRMSIAWVYGSKASDTDYTLSV